MRLPQVTMQQTYEEQLRSNNGQPSHGNNRKEIGTSNSSRESCESGRWESPGAIKLTLLCCEIAGGRDLVGRSCLRFRLQTMGNRPEIAIQVKFVAT